jgi:carbonic anhydrase
MMKPYEALQRLRVGNERFAAGKNTHSTSWSGRRAELVGGQEPFAVIVGCSDSRVPAELIFDQGFGDLFVIRVAGNIAQPSQIGSVEFAATEFGTRLIVVLGHSGCGAVKATIESLQTAGEGGSRNLRSIVEFIRPSVESLMIERLAEDPDLLLERAVRANVRATTERLRHGSPIIETLERDDGLQIVGAEYSLQTGLVEFLDEVRGNGSS